MGYLTQYLSSQRSTRDGSGYFITGARGGQEPCQEKTSEIQLHQGRGHQAMPPQNVSAGWVRGRSPDS